MPSAILAAAGGAGQGLEALIKRKMLEDQLQLQQQKEVNDQSYRTKALASVDADRKQRADETRQWHDSTSADRAADNFRQEGDSLRQNMQYMQDGTEFTPEQKALHLKHNFPAGMFPETDEYVPLPGGDSGPSQNAQHTIRLNRITPKGGSDRPANLQQKTYTLRRPGQPERAVDGNYNPRTGRVTSLDGQDITDFVEHRDAPDRVLTPVEGADGHTELQPRKDVKPGTPAPLASSTREGIDMRTSLLATAKEAKELGTKIGWNGVGPWDGTVGAFAHKYLGANVSGGDDGELLRNKLSRLTTAAFADGGKNLTGTEKGIFDQFMASTKLNGKVDAARLDEFIKEMEKAQSIHLGDTGGATPTPPPAAPTPGAGNGPTPASGGGDAYDEFIRRRRAQGRTP